MSMAVPRSIQRLLRAWNSTMWKGMTNTTNLDLQAPQLHLAVPVENRVAVDTAEWSALYYWQSSGCLGHRSDQCT